MSKINGVLFQVRWAFMSPEKKYQVLWQRTKRAMKHTSPVPIPSH